MPKRTNGAAKAAPSRSGLGAEQYLPALARSEARRRRAPAAPMRWSDALAEAPWSERLPAAWEAEFRRAYASELVGRGFAVEAARSGTSGKSGKAVLARYKISQTAEEHAAQEALAKAAGLDWARWARRKLAE